MLVDEGRVAGDDEQPTNARQAGDQILRNAVGEIFPAGIAAGIGEGQHGDRRAIRQGQIGQRKGALSLLAHLAHETQALARQRLDQVLAIAGVADRLAGGIDAVEQRRFRDGPPLPDRVQKIVLADHTVAMADQVNEQVEHLRLDRNRLRTAMQLAAIDVERAVFEKVTQSQLRLPRRARRDASTPLLEEKWREA